MNEHGCQIVKSQFVQAVGHLVEVVDHLQISVGNCAHVLFLTFSLAVHDQIINLRLPCISTCISSSVKISATGSQLARQPILPLLFIIYSPIYRLCPIQKCYRIVNLCGQSLHSTFNSQQVKPPLRKWLKHEHLEVCLSNKQLITVMALSDPFIQSRQRRGGNPLKQDVASATDLPVQSFKPVCKLAYISIGKVT